MKSIVDTDNEEKTKSNNQVLDNAVSAEEFYCKRANTIKKTVILLVRTLLICAVVCISAGVILFNQYVIDDEHQVGALIFTICSCVYLYIALIRKFIAIKEAISEFVKIRALYIRSIPEEEKKAYQRKAKITWVCFGVVVCIIVAALSVGPIQKSRTYNKAEQLIQTEQYDEATDLLKQIENKKYKDTASLLLLCKAAKEYENEHFLDAYHIMEKAEFRYLSSDMYYTIKGFENDLKEKYDQQKYKDDMYKAEIQKREREKLEKLKKCVPYVGMSSSYIADTSLGEPTKYEGDLKKGPVFYYFYSEGKIIFKVRCDDGVVTEVWDHRKESNSSHKSHKNIKPDEPSVDGFSNPEDFYDWYWEDFTEYYDAEDYYYEHGGK